MRLAALTALGLVLGAGGAVLTVSMVQAEDDDGIRAVQREDHRRAQSAGRQLGYAATAYAPSRGPWSLPLFRTQADGRIAHPPVVLNPFRGRVAEAPPAAKAKHKRTVRLDTVSGAADVARTICVRLCDGFHAPIGYLRAKADLKAHEALCEAMNPGVPVKVFKVAAGAKSIDEAQSSDGGRYGALPVAFGHEKASEKACRPAIVQEGERRVSLLRDITLRPGDSVVLDGKVTTFAGSSRWPYSTRDFSDFRSASELNAGQRRQIDERVGISRMEAEARGLRRQMRVREASLQDDSFASDAVSLRGSLDPQARGPVRQIVIAR
ncbi:hypothetical protein AXW83_03140 [Bosea sp. PAMC 26642]|nr:hypothetical protein AXW83_03140 [Bosea sp. PAMC 26642]